MNDHVVLVIYMTTQSVGRTCVLRYVQMFSKVLGVQEIKRKEDIKAGTKRGLNWTCIMTL